MTSIDHYDKQYVNLFFNRSICRAMCTYMVNDINKIGKSVSKNSMKEEAKYSIKLHDDLTVTTFAYEKNNLLCRYFTLDVDLCF